MSSQRVRISLKRALYTILLAVGLSAFVATNSTYAVNILTTATANVGATTILTGAGGLTLTGTPDSIGTLKTFDSVNISTGRQFSGAGIYLDSAGGVETGLGATLKTRLNTVLTSGGYSGTTTNVSALRFQVLVNSNITSVSFNYLFGSREGISDWDVAAILVDNTNFAFLPNGKVIRVNAASGLSRFTASGPFTGIGTWANNQTVTGIFDKSGKTPNASGQTTHEIIITVANTGDKVVDSVIMVANLNGGTATVGGVSTIPVNGTLPTVSGSASIGQVLTTTNGTWSGSPTSYTYGWQSSTNGSSGWTDISGATSSTYTIPSSLGGNYFRSAVIGRNASGAGAVAYSAATALAPGVMTITATSAGSRVYGAATPTAAYTQSGLISGHVISGLTYSYAGTGSTVYGPSATPPTAVGTYSITPSAAVFSTGAAANYSSISYTAGSFSITRATLTVTPTAAQSFAYGTASPTYAFSVTGFIGSETTSNATGYVAPTCSASGYSTTLAVGSPAFTISCSGGSAANYSFVTTATTTATITQAPLTVSAEGKSVNYGSLAPTYTFGITGWRNSETAANATDYVAPTCSSSYTRTSPAGTPVAITCSGASAKNYSFSYSSANITIAKLGTLGITAASPSAITFGAPTPTNSVSTSGMAANDVIASVTYTYAGTGSTVYGPLTNAPTLPGTYSITPSAVAFAVNGGATSNYTTITYTAGSLTINRPALLISASVGASSITYGSQFFETRTVTNLITGHAISGLTYTYAGTASTVYGPTTAVPTAVGTYSITPSAATFSSGSAANYTTITYTAGSFSITKAALTLTPDSFTVTYGSSAPVLTFAVSGLKYSDSISALPGYIAPTCSTTYTSKTEVAASPVAITCSGGSATNYTFSHTSSGSISITRKSLTISGTTIASRAFNGTATPGTISVGTLSGLISGESLGISTSANDYSSVVAGTYSTVVTYTLLNTASGLANNYTLGSQTISGVITPAIAGFNVALSQGFTADAFQTNYGSAETLTVTATTDVAGTATFKVSVNGGSESVITGCGSVTISSGVAICPWVNPTIGQSKITVSITPTSANQAVDPKSIDAIIVAKPFITNFTVRGQNSKTGPAGTVVVITGGNFVGITSIRFGTGEAEKTFRATATQATVTVPLSATTGKITLTTQFGGSTTSAATFTVLP